MKQYLMIMLHDAHDQSFSCFLTSSAIVIVVVSPNGAIIEMSCRLEHIRTNNQAEYEPNMRLSYSAWKYCNLWMCSMF